MEVLRCYLMFMIVTFYPFTQTFGYENKCDCDNVRDVLTKEIFDLKFVNNKLLSRLKHIETVLDGNQPVVQGNQPVAGQMSSIDTGRLLALEDKVALIELKLYDRSEYSKNSQQLNKLITKAFRSEKVHRLQTERKLEEGLTRINETFEDFKTYVDTRFGSHVKNISVRIADYTKHVSENVSRLENNVETIYANFENLENRTQELIERKIPKIEKDIKVISEDVSIMNGDINSVIDIVLLDQKAICEPNCTNGGVCYKDNNCKCKHLTKGARCEKVLCDAKCMENGGECVAPGACSCPEGRFGSNCEQRVCKSPEQSAKPKLSKIIYKPGDKLSDFECDYGYTVLSHKEMTCQDDGTWSDIVECVKAAVYLIRVKTADANLAGTDADVYIYLHGLNGKTNRINLNGSFEANDLDETRVMAEDVRPITEVVVGHDGSGSKAAWYLEFVSIYVEGMDDEYYVFRRSNGPVAVEGNDDVSLPRHENCIHSFDGGHNWFPRWGLIRKESPHLLIGIGSKISLRACKQKCTELTTNVCNSVTYNNVRKTCSGFVVSSKEYFINWHGMWTSQVYLRSCKQ